MNFFQNLTFFFIREGTFSEIASKICRFKWKRSRSGKKMSSFETIFRTLEIDLNFFLQTRSFFTKLIIFPIKIYLTPTRVQIKSETAKEIYEIFKKKPNIKAGFTKEINEHFLKIQKLRLNLLRKLTNIS